MNDAYGYWTKEETNWSDKDTEFVDDILKKDNKTELIAYQEIRKKYSTLSGV